MAFQFTYIKKSLFLLLGFYFFNLTNLRASDNQVPKFISTVFNNLYSSMDNGNVLKPKLVLSDNSLEVVSYYPGRNEIHIGNGFVALARNFGIDSNNVIAHVLGHELTHILIQKNAAIKEVGSGYASRAYNKSVRKLYKQLKDSIYERQADEYACFYAHISGYNVVDIAPTILDSIYIRFKLKDSQLRNYPKLKERKRIAIFSGQRMTALNEVFDKAILASVAQKHDLAKDLNLYILEKGFNSPEIYNNIGCSYLYQAIETIDSSNFPYVLPIQMDLKTNLYKKAERSFEVSNKELLTDAIYYFELATKKNKNYHIAWINQAISQFIIGELEDANISILYANRTKKEFLKEKISILNLVMSHKNGDIQNSIEGLSKLSEKSKLAMINLIRLDTNTLANPDIIFQTKNNEARENKISLPNLDFYSNEARKTDTILRVLGKKRSLSIRTLTTENFKIQKIRSLHGQKKPNMIVYKYLKESTIQKKHLISRPDIIDSIFTFENYTYIKCGYNIYKFQEEKLISSYKIY